MWSGRLLKVGWSGSCLEFADMRYKGAMIKISLTCPADWQTFSMLEF